MKTFSQLIVGDTIWFTDRMIKPIKGYITHMVIDNQRIKLKILWSDGLVSILHVTNSYVEKSTYYNFSTDRRESYKTYHKYIYTHNKESRKNKNGSINLP